MADKRSSAESDKIQRTVFKILDAVPPNASVGPYTTAHNLVSICKTDFPNMVDDDLIDHVFAWYEQNHQRPSIEYAPRARSKSHKGS